MARAILIGFVYSNGRRPLPGSLVDIYKMYLFLTQHGFSDIHVVCDMDDDPSTQDYRQAIVEGYVDANMLSFISEMQKKRCYHRIRSQTQLSTIITQLLTDIKQGFIYMTGHGEEHGFLCPEGLLAWPDLQTAIFTPLQKKCQVMMILDACHAWHFQLPYLLSRDKNRLSFVGKTFFPGCHFVLLMSQGKEAAATITGSLVTRSLISLLERGEDKYFTIRKKVEEDLVVTETLRSMQLQVAVYTSYPTLYRIWSWFWGKEDRPITTFDDGLFIEIASKS